MGHQRVVREFLIQEQRHPRFQHVAPDTDDRHRRIGEAHATLDRVGEADLVSFPIDDSDVHHLGIEDRLDLVADEVVHRLHVELLRQPFLHAVDDGQFGRALIRFRQQSLRRVEQAGILERHAHARCEGGEQSDIAVVECMRRQAFQRDDAEDAVAGQDRDAEPGLRDETKGDRAMTDSLRRGREVEGHAPADDLRREAGPEFAIPGRVALALLDRVEEPDPAGRLVVEGDLYRAGLEDRADSFADQLHDVIEVQLPRKGVADLVDEGELCVALPGLFDRAGTAEGRPDVLTDECEQVLVRVGVNVLLRVTLDGDDAEGAALGDQWRSQPVSVADDADQRDLATLCECPLDGGIDADRLAGPQHVGRQAARVPDAHRLPRLGIRHLQIHRVHVIRKVQRVALVVVQGDVRVVGVHELADDAMDRGIERVEIFCRAGCFGDPVQGVLDLLRSLRVSWHLVGRPAAQPRSR